MGQISCIKYSFSYSA